MIESILPGNKNWLGTHILEPYMEGSERIERAWNGKKIPAFIDTPLSLRERIVLLIKGTLLMIPLINTIIWVAMQVFAESKLSVPYFPPSEMAPLPFSPTRPSAPEENILPETPSNQTGSPSPVAALATAQAPPIAPEEAPKATAPPPAPVAPSEAVDLPSAPTRNQQVFWYTEKIGPKEFQGRWTIERFDGQTKIQKISEYNNSTAIHNQNGHLVSIHNKVPSEKKIFDAEIQQNGKIKATVSLNGKSKEATFEITGKGIWIQQPLFGLQNFALSKDTEIKFFFIHPEELSIIQMRGKKVGKESFEGLGNLLKIEANLDYWGAGAIHKGLTWVDPTTGIGRKSYCPSFAFYNISIPEMTELFLPDHP